MSLPTGHFTDAELTSFAMEILSDLGSQPLIDTTDSFICELADEIEKELSHFTMGDTESMSSLTTSLTSSYGTDPSLYLPPSASTPSYRDKELKLAYSSKIVSHCKLSISDSFNDSLPALPSPVTSPKVRVKSPMFPPPQSPFSVASNERFLSSCISPRNRQTIKRVLSVPDFSTKSSYKQPQKERKSIPKKRNDARGRSRSAKRIHNINKERKRRNVRKKKANSDEFNQFIIQNNAPSIN